MRIIKHAPRTRPQQKKLAIALALAVCSTLPGAAFAASLNGSKVVKDATPLHVEGDLYIGLNGAGEVIVQGGGQLSNVGTSTATLMIGQTSFSSPTLGDGSLTVTGTGSRTISSGGLMVGSSGKGSLTITDGGVVQNSTYAYLGAYDGSQGSAVISGPGSLWQVDGAWMMIGAQGAGTVTITNGGRVAVDKAGTLASRVGQNAEGALSVSGEGSAWTSTGDLAVGYLGRGRLTVADGGLVSNISAVLGDRAGGVGVADIDGGHWLGTGQLTVGSLGEGSLVVRNGGELVATRGIMLGYGVTAPERSGELRGSVLVTGSGSRLSTDGIITVGNLGRSAFAVTDGATASAGRWIIVGNSAEGYAEVSDGAHLDAAHEISVGHNALGVLDIGGGATVSSDLGRLGRFVDGDGRVTVSGDDSRWLTQALVLGEYGAGTLTIADGAAVSAASAGIVQLASFGGAHGTLNIGAGEGAGSLAATEVTGGAGTAVVNFNHSDTTSFTAALTGSLSVNVLGAGTTELSSASNYLGATSVAAGTLKAGGESVFSAASAHTLQPGAELSLAGFNQTVGALDNGGTVSFSDEGASGTLLTVAGDYVGSNGVLRMNAALAGDDSTADRMSVTGDTSGHTWLAVRNAGGAGASTREGILLVDVGGASRGAFELQGRAVAGAYEYLLYQGSGSDPANGNWYLRSELAAPVTPPLDPKPPVDPAEPTLPTRPQVPEGSVDVPLPQPPTAGLLRPEAGAYLINQAVAVDMFALSLHDRMGGPDLVDSETGLHGGAWSRIASRQARGALMDQLQGQSRLHVLQAGVDMVHWGSLGRGVVGIMGSTGESSQRVTSSVVDYQAQGRVKGHAAGIYGSWIQNAAHSEGLYVDGWAQAATFRNRVQGDLLEAERYSSRSTSASLEAGYAFAVHRGELNSIYIEPQAQLIWGDIHMRGGTHEEANGSRVGVAHGGGLRSRVGMRVFGHGVTAGMNRVQPYLTANWLHASGRPNAVWLDEVSVSGAQPKDVYEAKAGVLLQLKRGVTAWGELSGSRGNEHYRQVGGMLGLRYDW